MVLVVRFRRTGIAVGFALTMALATLLVGCDSEPSAPTAALPHKTDPKPSTGDHQRPTPGWTVTVYYTAVEYFHHGQGQPVVGCPSLECAHGHVSLGTHPASFVKAVYDEGTGRITTGEHAGKYLNWAWNVGYWLDDFPRDDRGQPLVPFRSAAADELPKGKAVRLLSCGTTDNGTPPPPEICQRLSDPTWLILDAFTPGHGGNRHIDLYIGEEDRPGFTDSPLYTTLHNTILKIN